jgi:hypothetical protein
MQLEWWPVRPGKKPRSGLTHAVFTITCGPDPIAHCKPVTHGPQADVMVDLQWFYDPTAAQGPPVSATIGLGAGRTETQTNRVFAIR